METIKTTIAKMLKENTGKHLMDSGDAYGRHWQKNQEVDFEKQPEVNYYIEDGCVYSIINTYHRLNKCLMINSLCKKFNSMECESFDGDYYGIDTNQQERLDNNGFTMVDSYNTYDRTTEFSQDFQFNLLEKEDGMLYVLLQTHNGCDIRGGYSDAKLFVMDEYTDIKVPATHGTIDGVQVSDQYNGYELRNDNNEIVKATEKSDIQLRI